MTATPLLEVGATAVAGWTQIAVTSSRLQACSTFSLTMVRSYGQTPAVRAGDECRVRYGDDVVMTGLVDSVETSYERGQHRYTVAGRSRTKDLVDCWAVPQQYLQLPALEVIRRVAADYGVEVLVDAPANEPIPDFQVSADQLTSFDAIQDAAAQAGVFITDDPYGHLVVTRAGSVVSANRLYMKEYEHVNVLAGRLREDESRRFSRYLCLGQQPSDDEQFGAATAQVMGEAIDPGVGRKRVRVIHAETPVTPETARRRAELELRSALVDAWAAEYTVQDWCGSGGRLWRANELVPIEDQLLKLAGTYLLVEVTYLINESGTTTELRFALPAALDPDRPLGA